MISSVGGIYQGNMRTANMGDKRLAETDGSRYQDARMADLHRRNADDEHHADAGEIATNIQSA